MLGWLLVEGKGFRMAKSEMYITKAGERRFQVAAPVSEEIYDDLRRMAYEQKSTIAAQVRQAVTEYVIRSRPPSSRVTRRKK